MDYGKAIKHADEVASANGLRNSIWSMFEDVTDFNAPHPYPNATRVRYESDAFWGAPSGTFVEPILGSTWLDLWRAADKLLGRVGDKHHVFIEGFDVNDIFLDMITGS